MYKEVSGRRTNKTRFTLPFSRTTLWSNLQSMPTRKEAPWLKVSLTTKLSSQTFWQAKPRKSGKLDWIKSSTKFHSMDSPLHTIRVLFEIAMESAHGALTKGREQDSRRSHLASSRTTGGGGTLAKIRTAPGPFHLYQRNYQKITTEAIWTSRLHLSTALIQARTSQSTMFTTCTHTLKLRWQVRSWVRAVIPTLRTNYLSPDLKEALQVLASTYQMPLIMVRCSNLNSWRKQCRAWWTWTCLVSRCQDLWWKLVQ